MKWPFETPQIRTCQHDPFAFGCSGCIMHVRYLSLRHFYETGEFEKPKCPEHGKMRLLNPNIGATCLTFACDGEVKECDLGFEHEIECDELAEIEVTNQ